MTARLSILLAVAMLVSGPARAASISVTDSRPFGYFLGDIVKRHIIVHAKPGESLDLGSLPRPGPVNYWLELAGANIDESDEGEGKAYRLTLAYQTFYAPLDPRKLTIPGFKLKIDSGTGSHELSVPELEFLTSPLRRLFASQSDKASTATELRPDHMGAALATGRDRTAMLVSGLIALASLIALARHNAWWPFHHRPQRPFTQAARYLRANAERLAGTAGYRAALLRLHRAFDTAAGRRVLSEDVDGFITQHPQFAPLTPEVQRLFAVSRQAFFANDVDHARAAMPLEAVTRLSERLGAAERRAA